MLYVCMQVLMAFMFQQLAIDTPKTIQDLQKKLTDAVCLSSFPLNSELASICLSNPQEKALALLRKKHAELEPDISHSNSVVGRNLRM